MKFKIDIMQQVADPTTALTSTIHNVNPDHIIVIMTNRAGLKCMEFHLDGDGELHNDNGPALVSNNYNYAIYWRYTGGRTISYSYRPTYLTKLWFKHGEFHNTNGPAMLISDDTENQKACHYYIDNKHITEKAFYRKYSPEKFIELEKKRTFNICGKKYSFHGQLPNGSIILTQYKKRKSNA